MAVITATIPRDLDWLPDDTLELYVGTENAADLASSTPAGGTLVAEISPWPGGVGKGGLGAPGLALGEFILGNNPGDGRMLGEPGSVLGYGQLSIAMPAPAVIEYEYHATDKCATLPVGVSIVDAAGNRTTGPEDVVQLEDPPIGARSPAVAATANPGEVRLSWTASPDV